MVDMASFGGLTKEYQIRLDPDKLDLLRPEHRPDRAAACPQQYQCGRQLHRRRRAADQCPGAGLYQTVQQIEDTVVKTQTGHRAAHQGYRCGRSGPEDPPRPDIQDLQAIYVDKNGERHYEDGKLIDEPDVVEGTALLQKGADADPALKGLEDKVKELNDHILPRGVKIVPFLDRSDLIHLTTHTVLHNLTEGIILVVIILMLFLGNVRGAIIVALTIPFALLFASTCLSLKHIPANLLSLGALDFGMVVDGAVVMVENIVRHLNRRNGGDETPQQKIRDAAHEVQRPVFYAIGIIITAYLPIFTLQAVEGRLFKPMAWTVAFALLGALIFSMIIAPVLASFLFRKGAKEWRNPADGVPDESAIARA